MYGLTDNIVAGPAGQVTAGAAGSFVAGPAGSFTPAPAGHTPVYPVTAGMPPSGAGYVPIDATPAQIPYAPHSGPVHMLGGGTQSPIPGPQADIPYSANTGGGSTSGTGGIMYVSSVGTGVSGGGGAGAIFSAISGAGGGGGLVAGGGGGGVSISGGGGMSVSGGGGGGGLIAGGGGVSGGGGGLVAGGSASTSSGAIAASSGGGGGGGVSGGGGGGVSGGGSFAPLEVHMGVASAPATGFTPVSPATPGNPTTPGGHVVPSPVGYLHPPPALRFHAPQYSRISRHPVHVETHTINTQPWQEYKPSYVWQGRDPADPPPPFLASDYLKASPYEPPHLLFRDERVGTATVDASIGAQGSVDIRQSVTTNLFQDFSQPHNLEFNNNTYNERNVVLDNSITRVLDQSFPEFRQNTVNIVQPQIVAQGAQTLEPTLPLLTLGGPVMARVA